MYQEATRKNFTNAIPMSSTTIKPSGIVPSRVGDGDLEPGDHDEHDGNDDVLVGRRVRPELARQEAGARGGRHLRSQVLLGTFDRAPRLVLGGRHNALAALFGHGAYFGIR